VECAVLGNRKPIASVIGEVLTDVEFYTYEAKYKDPDSKTAIPANLPVEISEQIRKTAVEAYRMLGCTGLSRVDFFVRNSDNAILLNELNTLPGFTSISMYPKLFEAAGIPTPELLDRLIELALERAG
jgi:D-alanine-D-alanine ligase